MDLAPYLAVLARGGVVACATETLVGLLADARSAAAVARVAALKSRERGAIALLLPDGDALSLVAESVSDTARALMAAYWPGPLTVIVSARAGLPHGIALDGTVGVRVPGASPALDLVRAYGAPLTATSCNPTGLPAARDAAEAQAYFGAAVDAYVPGRAAGGVASTLVDATGAQLRVLRAGAVRLEPSWFAETSPGEPPRGRR